MDPVYDENTRIEKIEDFESKGRKQICIPIPAKDFFKMPEKFIINNLSNILSKHNQNVAEMKYLKDFYLGVQDILNKVRANNDNINNKDVINYAWQFINFKKGYCVGEPIKYISKSTEDVNDELEYLNKWMSKCNKSSKDIDKYENLFITGVAYTLTIPNEKFVDEENDSPFKIILLDNKDVCMVYSNDSYKTPLFSMMITYENEYNERFEVKKQRPCYYCYMENNEANDSVKRGKLIKITEINYDKYKVEVSYEPMAQPITEYLLNKNRMGVFEPVLSTLNFLNKIRSNQDDNIEEFINYWLIFLNQDPEALLAHIKEYRENKVIALKTNNPSTPADAKMLSASLNHSDINSTYDGIKNDVFNIVGVPMGTSSTGQGVSGTSQQYGSGWENAQSMAKIDTTYIKQFEKMDLEKFISISKSLTNVVNDISEMDIDIKFTLSKSNDIMTKAQSFKYLTDAGVTYADSLELTQLSDDSAIIGERTEKNFFSRTRKLNEIEIEKEKKLAEISSSKTNEQNPNDTQDDSQKVNQEDDETEKEEVEENKDNKDNEK